MAKGLLIDGDPHYCRIAKAVYEPEGTLTRGFVRVGGFGDSGNGRARLPRDALTARCRMYISALASSRR